VSVLTCSQLEKRYGDLRAVDGVSFEVTEGETYGLLGPNGAGKTTTISIIAGLLRPDAGEVHVLGEQLTPRSSSAKAAIGLVPQELAVYPDLTARENLRFFGRLHGLGRAELARRMDEVLEVTGLTDRADDRADTFSGGMKRRLNIGVGLLHRPKLLVLDEPTVGVDPQSRNAILESVEQLATEGMAVLYTTHYMEEAERLCDRVGIVDLGHLIAEGRSRDLTARLGAAEHIVLSVEGDVDRARRAIDELVVVERSTAEADTIDVLVPSAESALPLVMQAVTGSGSSIRSVVVQEPDLEAVFLHLTGKRLRD
jgi:ABC-2 type transport system ATP-binding protein